MAHEKQASNKSTPLRVIIQRLAATPTWQLPHVVPTIAATVAGCEDIFRGADVADENAILLHSFKTRLTALLQDKSPQARFASIVLIKATVESGGWNILQGAGTWIKGLIGLLVVSLYLITISNIRRLL